MADFIHNTFIGGDKWKLSDEIYFKLTNTEVISNYNPIIPVSIKKIPEIIPEKQVYGLFWGTPTFKDTDCQYLLHINDDKDIDIVIATSSGNTVEGMARAVRNYNQTMKKSIKAILLVPEFSADKVDSNEINFDENLNLVSIKNSNLDHTRIVANEIQQALRENYNIAIANGDIKTAAYSQMGFAIEEALNDDYCFVQTVSGAVGPTGVLEAAYQLNRKIEMLNVQLNSGITAPVVDALEAESSGIDPLSIFQKNEYQTPAFEKTLGSTKPIYAINKFINWRKQGIRINGCKVNKEEMKKQNETIADILIQAEVYPNKEISSKLYEIERSGFIAFMGAIKSKNIIQSDKIIINFTGRYLNSKGQMPIPAEPDINYDATKGIKYLLHNLDLL